MVEDRPQLFSRRGRRGFDLRLGMLFAGYIGSPSVQASISEAVTLHTQGGQLRMPARIRERTQNEEPRPGEGRGWDETAGPARVLAMANLSSPIRDTGAACLPQWQSGPNGS
jgi:hypothetical protein